MTSSSFSVILLPNESWTLPQLPAEQTYLGIKGEIGYVDTARAFKDCRRHPRNIAIVRQQSFCIKLDLKFPYCAETKNIFDNS